MSDKKQYEKPVLESCGTMTEQTRGASYNNGGSLPSYTHLTGDAVIK